MNVGKGRLLCVDFDGVIHSYTSGWQGADTIPDEPLPGAFEWLALMLDSGFRVAVFSSRSGQSDGRGAMRLWFEQHGFERVAMLEFPESKPPAFLTLDDRAICFTGVFPALEQVAQFRTWQQVAT